MSTQPTIRVAAIFGPGRTIRPVWFDLKNRKHAVREVTYRWQEQAGETLELHFSVSDGTALFELVYDTARQTWRLAALEPHR